MEKLYQDFINGDEIKLIKTLLKSVNAFVLTAITLSYLVTLYFMPHFMIAVTAFAIVSLFVTHFIKKWSKEL